MNIQRPKIKINKTWLMLIVAILLSLLTTWLTMQYLKSREQSIAADMTARNQLGKGATISVVVPRQSLPPGTILTESMVAAREVPVDFTYEDTITVAQFDAFKGQALLRQVEKGRPLRKTDVRELFADFSGTLKTGKRAMTINIDDINSISHMIEPGNLVDLMLVVSGGGDASSQSVVPFLDQVRVLATGQKITHDNPGSRDQAENRRTSYANITLEVTPTQAARLTLAGELGKLRAVLRNENDKQSIDYESVNANNLLEEIRERERRKASLAPKRYTGDASYIEYIIGGKGSSDAVAPTINIMQPPGAVPATGNAAAAQPAAGAITPEVISQMLKFGAANKSAIPK